MLSVALKKFVIGERSYVLQTYVLSISHLLHLIRSQFCMENKHDGRLRFQDCSAYAAVVGEPASKQKHHWRRDDRFEEILCVLCDC